jgi:hypothetical protein
MQHKKQPSDRGLAFFRAVAVGVAFAASAAVASAQPCEFWVAPPPAGNNANPGTFAQPWATLQHAVNTIPDAGCTVWAKDGLYTGRQRMNRRFATPATFRAINPYRAIFEASETVITIFGGRNIVIEGLEIRHAASGASPLVIQVQQDVEWAEDIVFRNNVLHDSRDNDILKINNGARRVTVEGNVFFNQTGSDEHIDVNSVTDVVIQDNIFFNDFEGSGRTNANDTSGFIVIKDSNADDDGQIGSERITVRRNVFLNWQGSGGSNFVLTGEDGQPFHEAVDVLVENNLMIGNSGNDMRAPFGVKGCRNVNFRNNTVVGNLPSCAYGMRLNQEGSNPVNDNITFYNNIWSDPTGTMGTGCGGGNDFSDGLASETNGEVLDRNLYWNGGAAIPAGDVFSPLVHDVNRIVGNPLLNTNQAGVVLSRWTGTAFLSGNATIRQEFERLVNTYGAIPTSSPAVGQANPARAPTDDILGQPRSVPDLGAFEATAPPDLSISNASVTEGQSGTAIAPFTLTLSHASGLTVTVQYATADGTATAGTDYTASTGTITFPPGVVSRPLSITVLGDVLDEPDETFLVNLSSAVNATIADGQGVGTILDDDPAPVMSVDDCAVTEGNAGSVVCGLTVTLSAPSGRTITVNYATANGTATAGSDYNSASGGLTFTPGQVSKPVDVTVLGDAAVELDEDFVVDVTGATNATVGDAQGQGTILDDDAPSLSSNELVHGAMETADLAADPGPAADEDLYRLGQQPRASYEVVVDATSGDVSPVVVERLGSDNTTVLQTSTPVGTGSSRSLRWENVVPGKVVGQHIRVRSGGCTTDCGTDDVYRIRAYETTYSIPRFNNAGSQVTVLLLQNPTPYTIIGRAYFWDGAGVLLYTHAFTLAPKGLLGLGTSTIPALQGKGGSITVSNDGRYGELAGKAIALEPATGFSFDSPMVPRPR